eukprot:8317962-Heterocapsa_arctica.AAC.1
MQACIPPNCNSRRRLCRNAVHCLTTTVIRTSSSHSGFIVVPSASADHIHLAVVLLTFIVLHQSQLCHKR